MNDIFFGFITVFLVGMIFYGILWWEGSWFSLRFTKWYISILIVVSIISGIYMSS